ncbi:putative dual specificity protein phosphatase DSP8 [Zea mays]|uniref:Putative dual specificity protein phosphatase DSP8 n=1 Tax=Zea mays TaxID=4577 RepID=A0A3L6FFV2_MAIZE|nr:putative dual specificity protein phosphatase DSP8 [Zea mays]
MRICESGDGDDVAGLVFQQEQQEEVQASGELVRLKAKHALVGAGARVLFYPTLLYNVLRNRFEADFRWWDRVDQFILLGAVPFPSDVPRLKQLGVQGVVTLNEPYETLVPTSLYQANEIEHLVIPTRDYLFAPSLEDISQAIDFIHRMHGQLNFDVIKYRNMTPEAALDHVRSIRPRVLLAPSQWHAVNSFGALTGGQLPVRSTNLACFLEAIEAGCTNTTGNDDYHVMEFDCEDSGLPLYQIMLPRPASPTGSGCTDAVLVTEADLEGYDTYIGTRKDAVSLEVATRSPIMRRLSCLFGSLKLSNSNSAEAALAASLLSWRGHTATPEPSVAAPPPFAGFLAGIRRFRKGRRGQASAKRSQPQDAPPPPPPPPPKEREIELVARIGIEEDMPDDPEVLNIVEILKLNVPMAMKIALDGLLDSSYSTRDTSISDVGKYDKVEVSVLLCNDNFIQDLNKEWRDVDCATDILSMSQYIPDLDVPILMLGDIVISVEAAERQAGEKGVTLLDEVRVLVSSNEAAAELEKEEQLILKSLRWKGKGLAKSVLDSSKPQTDSLDGQVTNDLKKAGSLRFYKPKFKYIFCDMDGTLLNSKSQVSARNAEALREARSRGVNIVIATGKARPAVIDALSMVDLSGRTGIVSESSPGVFLQFTENLVSLTMCPYWDPNNIQGDKPNRTDYHGLLVYGLEGRQIYKRNLDQEVCREALSYSIENKIPLVAFSQDHCYSMFDHPLVDSLHYIYHEPKAKIVPSIGQLLETAEIQKVLFLETPERISSALRPYWAEAIEGRAHVVQAQPDMLELVPPATSKGNGVKVLLNHLSISPDEVMAIGDGENDIEMLQLASFGVALANGSDKTKAAANVIGATNDEDGVAQAIYEYAF